MHITGACTHRLGEFAGNVGDIEDLIVKNGEVESEAEADGVTWGHLTGGNL